MKKALIIVDVQNDFLPGGSLQVAKSDEILPLINRLLKMPFDVRIATRDWHPPHHCSFASTWGKKAGERILLAGQEQALWPDHCIQDSFGSEFSKDLNAVSFDHIVHKGTELGVDSYSTFFDNLKLRTTGLEQYLRGKEVHDLYFAGLTTEYCVYYSVVDALELGFTAHVVSDACRGVDLIEGDARRAMQRMKEMGVELLTTQEVAQRIK